MVLAVAQHLLNNVLVLLALFVADRALIVPLVAAAAPKLTSKGLTAVRWFLVHSIANAGVCLTALTSMRAVLLDPVQALDGRVYTDASLFGSASAWPLTIINSVHLYHMVGGFALTGADYFHHGLFIPTLGLPGQLLQWGPLANWQAFFISGLPGGVDYLLLALVKLGRLPPMTEKRVNANLNTWLRAPGILVATVLLYQALLLGNHVVPPWAVGLQLVLPAYNALYFNKQAVANYAVHYMLELLGQRDLIERRVEQRTSYTTGLEVMAWKDCASGRPRREAYPVEGLRGNTAAWKEALGVPQRGS